MSNWSDHLFHRSADDGAEQPDHLAYVDQATFLSNIASGRRQIMHALWFYEEPLDYDGLRKFHESFGHTMASRRIERSPVPFGRHRWVLPAYAPGPLDIAETARPRSELSDWLQERSQVPVDPEHGPSWHMGVQPFTDGSTGVSIVVSHCVIDGAGGVMSALEAMNGFQRPLPYSAPHSRRRWQAIKADLRQTRRDLPDVRHALASAIRLARKRRGDAAANRDARPSVPRSVDADEIVAVPFATALFNAAEWDRRAEELHGNSYSLVAAYASRLGELMGRAGKDDGQISLMVVVNDRLSLEDTRANAMLFTHINVDPNGMTEDLTSMRNNIRTALKTVKDTPDESFELLPLTPFIPRRAVGATANLVFGDLPVTCSNFGDVPLIIGSVDGVSNASVMTCFGADQNMRKADLERGGGMLIVASGRYNDQVIIGAVGYQVGAANERKELLALVEQTADEFGLAPTMTF